MHTEVNRSLGSQVVVDTAFEFLRRCRTYLTFTPT